MTNKKPVFAINWNEVDTLVAGMHDNPHHILGMHETTDGVYINAYFPGAKSVIAIKKTTKEQFELICDRVAGFFSVKIEQEHPFVYYFEVENGDGTKKEIIDPYSFEAVIDPIDISKFHDGIHYEIYEKMGAHPCILDGVEGVLFAVWAPHAARVSVVGNFNEWNGKLHMMRRIEYSGVFEIFIPGIECGEIYKYEIMTREGNSFMKPDPYANGTEMRPGNASKIVSLSYEWKHQKKYDSLLNKQGERPMNIYEVHLGSFKRPKDGKEYFSYRELAKQIADYVNEMGYTHVELLPVMEYENDASWGYHTSGFYAPSSRYGEPVDFMYFVDYLHSKGIGVICDWIPCQFPMSEGGLARFDGKPLYEPQDDRRSQNPRVGTYIFDYGKKEVRNYLISNAIYWISKYHIDGIRMDRVASMLYLDYGKTYGDWIPNEYGGNENLDAISFLKEMNSLLKERFPNCLLIAQEESGWPMLTGEVNEGGIGFDYKWNDSWMKNLMNYMTHDPQYRKYEHKMLTNSLSDAFTEKFILAFSHKEMLEGHGSIVDRMPGGYEEKFANLRLLYGFMMLHPGKKLMFMGQEFAQIKPFDEMGSLDWDLLQFDAHSILKHYVMSLNHFYKQEPALYMGDSDVEGFAWINESAANESTISFLRKTAQEDDMLLVVCNFSSEKHSKYRIGVPKAGTYKEVFCSDDVRFGGDGLTNAKTIASKRSACDNQKNSICVNLAPLSIHIFKLEK